MCIHTYTRTTQTQTQTQILFLISSLLFSLSPRALRSDAAMHPQNLPTIPRGTTMRWFTRVKKNVCQNGGELFEELGKKVIGTLVGNIVWGGRKRVVCALRRCPQEQQVNHRLNHHHETTVNTYYTYIYIYNTHTCTIDNFEIIKFRLIHRPCFAHSMRDCSAAELLQYKRKVWWKTITHQSLSKKRPDVNI